MDLAAVKKSRACFTGAVTKLKDKLKTEQAREPSTYRTNVIQKATASLSNTEAGFLQTMEDVQELLPEEEAEALAEEEQQVLEAFTTAVNEVQDLAELILNARSISVGLTSLNGDIQALRDNYTA